MVEYFVAFYAEEDGELPNNDVIQYHQEISEYGDIKNIEEKIAFDIYGDDRKIVLINYKKI